jgi:nuclear pore complex protein Nup188
LSDSQGKSKFERFLSDPFTVQLLTQPFDAFAKATPQSKSTFETKTSAINVTPTTNGKHSIAEIKEDSVWLCKEAEIDEVSALRIVVIECQTRSSAGLRRAFSAEETSSLLAATGSASDIQLTSTSRALLAGAGGLGTDAELFNSKECRRLRIIETYLLERCSVIKCAEHLLQMSIYSDYVVSEKIWMGEVSGALITSMKISGPESRRFLSHSIKSLQFRFEKLGRGSGWFKEEGGREDVELHFMRSQLTEVISILEMMYQIHEHSGTISSAGFVLEWFKLVSAFGFFDQFEAVSLFLSHSTSWASIDKYLHSHIHHCSLWLHKSSLWSQ